MRIRGTDLEILAGSGESITYIRYDRTFNDEGVLGAKVKGSFVSGEDVITFKVYASTDDNIAIITKTADIIDGKACISLLESDTNDIYPTSYIYDVFWEHLTDEPLCLVAPSNFDVVFTSKTELGS